MHDFFLEILRNPARAHRAGLMRQFRFSQLDSTHNSHHMRRVMSDESLENRYMNPSELVGYPANTLDIH